MADLKFLDDLFYHGEHTWIKVDGDEVTIGITDYAQDQLGEIIFVELPSVGDVFAKGDIFGQAESAKSVSSLYLPISGKILAVNEAVGDDPELVNKDPYGEGWMIRLKPSDSKELSELLTKDQYLSMISQ